MGPADLEVEQLLVRMILLILQGLLPIQNLLTEGDLIFDILF